jgi:hypothetical protein
MGWRCVSADSTVVGPREFIHIQQLYVFKMFYKYNNLMKL